MGCFLEEKSGNLEREIDGRVDLGVCGDASRKRDFIAAVWIGFGVQN